MNPYTEVLKQIREDAAPFIFGILIVIMALVMICSIASRAGAVEIDLSIISRIESSNNPLAYNRHSGAVGLYQITPICLSDYNLCHKTCYEVADLISPKFNTLVAQWYLTVRIPQMLRAKGKPVTLENILVAYNAGIGRLVKGIMPQETVNYIAKYNKLAKRGL